MGMNDEPKPVIPFRDSGLRWYWIALLVVVFDRPSSPGNIGTLVRSADAFGATGVIVTGHAADIYDPKAVRASTGSIFAVPVVRVPSHRSVLSWIGSIRDSGIEVRVAGADEDARVVAEFIDSLFPMSSEGYNFDLYVSNADVNTYKLEAIRVPTLIVHTKDDQLASH